MKIALTAAAIVALATAALAGAKDYQVTGPVLEVTDSIVVVQKGKERWEINRSGDTKGAEALKVGDKVTIYYKMTATKVESKGTAEKSEKK
jgi:hypothetical protein